MPSVDAELGVHRLRWVSTVCRELARSEVEKRGLLGRNCFPSDGEFALAPAVRAVDDRPAVGGEPGRGGRPALPRTVRGERRGGLPGRVEGGQQRVDPFAWYVPVDQRFGQPLGQSSRSIQCGQSSRRVSVTGPAASSATQHPTRPSSSQVPSTSNPPAASRASNCSHAGADASSGYCRRTFIARMTTGRSPAHSKPPRRNSSAGGSAAGAAAATRSGSISNPTTRTSGRTSRNRAASSTVVTGAAP